MSPAGPEPLPSDRSFGLTFTAVFAALGAMMAYKSNPHYFVALGLSVFFLAAALAFPAVLHPLNVAWMRLGAIMNRIVSPIVLGVIYFGFLTPIAAAMRGRGRDPLLRRFGPELKSYWIKRDPPGPDGSTFPRQF